MRKSYEQYCPIAHALDLVGERWALLVVRELMHGPKRYTDLADHLPGIGTNILAARLRALEECGLVAKRRLPPPAASQVYELTEYGQSLRTVMRELALWGARSLGPPTAGDELFPGWLENALDTILAPVAPSGRFEFRVGERGRVTRRRRGARGARSSSRTSSSRAIPRGSTGSSSTGAPTASRSREIESCSSGCSRSRRSRSSCPSRRSAPPDLQRFLQISGLTAAEV